MARRQGIVPQSSSEETLLALLLIMAEGGSACGAAIECLVARGWLFPEPVRTPAGERMVMTPAGARELRCWIRRGRPVGEDITLAGVCVPDSWPAELPRGVPPAPSGGGCA